MTFAEAIDAAFSDHVVVELADGKHHAELYCGCDDTLRTYGDDQAIITRLMANSTDWRVSTRTREEVAKDVGNPHRWMSIGEWEKRKAAKETQ